MSDTSYRLRSEEGTAEGMRRIAGGRVAKAAERLRGAGSEDLAEAIHGARKDLKKLRALLRLIRGELGADVFKRENRLYREAGRALAESRDAEVKLATLRELRRGAGGRMSAAPAGAWERLLEADRERVAAGGGGEAAARIERALAMLEGGEARIAAWRLREEGWELVEAGLTGCYADGRRNLTAVGANGTDAEVHELRKRTKDLWYQLRILAEAWPGPLEATIEEVHRLAELLGDHHDLSVLAADLAERDAVVDVGGGIERLIAERQAELLEQALAIGARVFAEKPGAFRRRIRAYWRAWRGE